MKVYITPSAFLESGHAERVLRELGAGPVTYEAGRLVCDLSEVQLLAWAVKGPAHRLESAQSEIVAAPEVPEIMGRPAAAPVAEVPQVQAAEPEPQAKARKPKRQVKPLAKAVRKTAKKMRASG